MTAIRLTLDTPGFEYKKWGDTQWCKRGDFIVESQGDVRTVDADVFARTYREVTPGRYLKVLPVWAEQATSSGVVHTKEGKTHYQAGDFIVSNDEAGSDSWAMGAEEFAKFYVPADDYSASDVL